MTSITFSDSESPSSTRISDEGQKTMLFDNSDNEACANNNISDDDDDSVFLGDVDFDAMACEFFSFLNNSKYNHATTSTKNTDISGTSMDTVRSKREKKATSNRKKNKVNQTTILSPDFNSLAIDSNFDLENYDDDHELNYITTGDSRTPSSQKSRRQALNTSNRGGILTPHNNRGGILTPHNNGRSNWSNSSLSVESSSKKQTPSSSTRSRKKTGTSSKTPQCEDEDVLSTFFSSSHTTPRGINLQSPQSAISPPIDKVCGLLIDEREKQDGVMSITREERECKSNNVLQGVLKLDEKVAVEKDINSINENIYPSPQNNDDSDEKEDLNNKQFFANLMNKAEPSPGCAIHVGFENAYDAWKAKGLMKGGSGSTRTRRKSKHISKEALSSGNDSKYQSIICTESSPFIRKERPNPTSISNKILVENSSSSKTRTLDLPKGTVRRRSSNYENVVKKNSSLSPQRTVQTGGSRTFSYLMKSWKLSSRSHSEIEVLPGGILSPATLNKPFRHHTGASWSSKTPSGNATSTNGNNNNNNAALKEKDASCECSNTLFSEHDDLVEFFLPKLYMTFESCACGKQQFRKDDPTSVANILRPWQVDFLLKFGIRKCDQLVKTCHRSSNVIAKAMKRYRDQNDMAPVKTISCGLALHIWSRCCKVYVRSIRAQQRNNVEKIRPLSIVEILSKAFVEKKAQITTERRLSKRWSTTPPRNRKGTGNSNDEDDIYVCSEPVEL